MNNSNHQTHKKKERTVMKTVVSVIGFLLAANMGVSQSYDGYTLYFPQNGTKAYLIDLAGSTYHSWTFNASAKTCYSTYLISGGVLLRTVNHQGNYFSGGPISGEVQKVDWAGNVIWDFVYSTQQYCTHHDIHEMPNGNVLLIAYERKTPAEVTQAGCQASLEMWPDKIVEIQPSGTTGGTVVWEWHVWDHLVQDHDATKNNYGVVADHPELLDINYQPSQDLMHMNGIDYNEALDQIIFSSHALNEIYVVDHSTTTAEAASHNGGNSGKGGDFLYRWGNPAVYGAPGTADFNVVHDAHWIPADYPFYPNAMVGFNNKGGSGGKSCVDIFVPPYNGYNYSLSSGSAYAPATYNWRNTYSGQPTPDNGNSQQLPNGNTLVCIGMSGVIYEIDSNQNQVWTKSFAQTTLPQAFRYPPCFVNGNYSATATGTPSSVCTGTSVQLDVSATGGDVYIYSWTSNPPGFSSSIRNPEVTPDATTTYTVTIRNGPCSATDSVTITVNPVPDMPVVSLSGDTLFSSAAAGNQWYLEGNIIPGATNYFHVPQINGIYQVQVTDPNNCVSQMSAAFDVTWLSASSLSSGNPILLYPNPTTGTIRFSFNFTGTGFEAILFDASGRCMLHRQNPGTLDLSGMENGIYFLTVRTSNGEVYRQKIVLMKN
jgi:hypothetical protein